jgi:hypothetical protein
MDIADVPAEVRTELPIPQYVSTPLRLRFVFIVPKPVMIMKRVLENVSLFRVCVCIGGGEALGGSRMWANIPPPICVGRVNYTGQNVNLERASF